MSQENFDSSEANPRLPDNIEDLENDELKALVIENLKNGGSSNETALKTLVVWTSRKEREARTGEDRVRFEIERSDLYFEADLHDEGVQALEDALFVANMEGIEALIDEIEKKWKNL